MQANAYKCFLKRVNKTEQFGFKRTLFMRWFQRSFLRPTIDKSFILLDGLEYAGDR